ncbi:hypothetical protein Tco_0881365 [Tanacetum coccineum]
MLRLKEVDRKTVRKLLIYAFSDSLLLTPLCYDDIHDVMPRVSALAGCDRLVSEPLVIEKVEEKMTLKEADGKTVEEIETKIIAKDGIVTRVPGKFQGYETSEEDPIEQPRRNDLYGFVDHP